MPNTFAIAGAAASIGLGVYLLLRRRKLMRFRQQAEGEVVEVHRSFDDVFVTIRFITAAREVVTKKYNVGQDTASKIGDKRSLFYNPDRPTEFTVDGPVEKWVPVIFIIMGIVFLILSLTVFRNSNHVSL